MASKRRNLFSSKSSSDAHLMAANKIWRSPPPLAQIAAVHLAALGRIGKMSNIARRSGIRRKGPLKLSSLSFFSEVLRELTIANKKYKFIGETHTARPSRPLHAESKNTGGKKGGGGDRIVNCMMRVGNRAQARLAPYPCLHAFVLDIGGMKGKEGVGFGFDRYGRSNKTTMSAFSLSLLPSPLFFHAGEKTSSQGKGKKGLQGQENILVRGIYSIACDDSITYHDGIRCSWVLIARFIVRLVIV